MRKEVMDIAERWLSTIRQSSMETLHSDAFLQRVSKGAEYFGQHLDQLFEKPLRMSEEVKSNNKQAMKRLSNILTDFKQSYGARQTLLYQIAIKGFTIEHYLREKQRAMLNMMAMEEETGRSVRKRQEKPKKPKEPKEKSWAITLRMRKEGLQPEEIAVKRCLAMSTIIGHLIRYLETGDITIDEIISSERQQAIRKAIDTVGSEGSFSEIKALCPPGTTYDEIRLMMQP